MSWCGTLRVGVLRNKKKGVVGVNTVEIRH